MPDSQDQNWKTRVRYFPCHSVTKSGDLLDPGHCTCRRGAGCESSGKHPKTTGWQKQATSDPAQVSQWQADPTINLGILCGEDSDLLVLDIDVKDADGFATLAALEAKNEPLPTTYTVRTQSGGSQKYFKHRPGIQNKVKFAPGLDIRTEGGLVIAAGGRGIMGTYEVVIDSDPVELPDWLAQEIIKGQEQGPEEPKKANTKTRIPQDGIKEGGRNDTLHKLGSKLRGQGWSQEGITAALLAENRTSCNPPLSDSEVRTIANSVAQYEAGSLQAEFDDSDGSLTNRFATDNRDAIRYLEDDRSWRTYENGIWVERLSGPVLEIGNFLQSLEPPDANKTLHKRLYSEKAVKAVLFLGRDRPEFRIRAAAFDPDPWVLGLPHGKALDLRTQEVRDARPSDLLTRTLPVVPSDQELHLSCPRWMEYLDQAHPGEKGKDIQKYLQRFAGYSMTNSVREEMILFLIGCGGAGKGVYWEHVQAVLGSYATALPLDLLLEEAKEDRRLNHIAALLGTRLGVCNEGARSKKLDVNALKHLTGGGITKARRLGHQPFDFPMTTKIVVVANSEPVLDLDEPMKQRVHVVPFTQQFRGTEKDDKGLKDYLKSNELPGIARWMLDGCREWLAQGLKPPPEVKSRTEQYFQNADLLEQFLEERCEFADGYFEPTLSLFRDAKNFCEARGDKTAVATERLFISALLERRKTLQKARPRGKGFSGQSGLTGIKLRRDQEDQLF